MPINRYLRFQDFIVETDSACGAASGVFVTIAWLELFLWELNGVDKPTKDIFNEFWD